MAKYHVAATDAQGRLTAPSVLSQIDARTKATMRADLPALAEELGIGGVGIPTFATLAEAQQWEAAHPGRVALWLDGVVSPPTPEDTVNPVAGTLTVTAQDATTLVATVTGASDETAVAVALSFRIDSGGWSGWQDGVAYTFSALTPDSSYTVQHRVRDDAGNITEGTPVTERTKAAPPAPGTVITSESFSVDGDVAGRSTDAALGGTPVTMTGTPGAFVVENGVLALKGAGELLFSGLDNIADVEIQYTVATRPSANVGQFLMVRESGTYYVANNHITSSILMESMGPGGFANASGPAITTAGETITMKLVGNTLTYTRYLPSTGQTFTTNVDPAKVMQTDAGRIRLKLRAASGMRIKDLKVTAR